MKILLIGSSGIIGKAVAEELSEHEVIKVNNKSGDYQVDIESRDSITALFSKIGKVDAIISTAGAVTFAPVNELTFEQLSLTVNNKLLGNLSLYQIGRQYLNEGGSITFTSGFLAQNPMYSGAAASLVNAALDSFVKAAAFELDSTIRVNTVSPIFVKETMALMGMDTSTGMSAADTAKAYRHALTTTESGQAFDVADYA